jgi:CheY-like chemotaxis protein
LTLSTYADDGEVYLRITDTGQGIPEEHYQRIFEPFFTTKGPQSSGLGLSSCYGIVKKHQGDIQVNSIPGEGTEFVIRFPEAQPFLESVAMEKGGDDAKTPVRFLLIDDEINILKAVEMYFEDTEINITTAQTAQEGLSAVKSELFDVILCDLGMDDMNGLEVGKRVGTYCLHRKINKIPFLLYTGLDKQLDAVKLKESFVDRVVNKPTSCEDLLHIIREAVSIDHGI